MRVKNKALGPDDIPEKALALLLKELTGPLRQILTECLRTGIFPQVWKETKLVLPKPERTPSTYRPICLLDDANKILERIIGDRVVLSRGTGPDLSPDQYGFRVGRSIIDAILRIRTLTESVLIRMKKGRVCLAVALDISNTLP